MNGQGRSLGWLGICRLGLVQASLGAIVVLVTSTLNRVMVVEYSLPAMLPGALVALHYLVQMVRPRFGHGSDQGGRRTPWIVAGMAILAVGGVLCAIAAVLLPKHFVAGLTLAVVAYAAVGLGVGAAGTSLLVMLAQLVDDRRRAAAATIMWVLMIFGFAVTQTVVGHFLDPFSAARLIRSVAVAGLMGCAVTVAAVWGVERGPGTAPTAKSTSGDFQSALRTVWSEPEARRFTVFVFVSMLAYSAQELLLEPFAGLVFGYTLGASAKLSGMQHGAVFIGMLSVGVACSGARRFGSLRAWTLGGCIASALSLSSLAAASFIGPVWPLRLSVVALGLSNGVLAVAAIGSMMELAQHGTPGSAGVRMGLWGAAQAVAFALGGLLSTTLVDAIRYFFGSPIAAFGIVFCAEACLFLLASRYAAQVRRHPVATAAGGEIFDVIVIGGGPAGATAANDLAGAGVRVCLIDRAGRIKPCGGAVPPKLVEEFAIPQSLLVARVTSARMISPSCVAVDMPIEGGYVGMVDREVFDEWLRQRAQAAGVDLRQGLFKQYSRDAAGVACVRYLPRGSSQSVLIRAKAVIGADGAMSMVAKQCIAGAHKIRYVAAYHEILRLPGNTAAAIHPTRCDVFYQGKLSPDFYAWIFPHGETASVGVGSAQKGFSLRRAVAELRAATGSGGFETVRSEGAPIPMKPLRRWDNGRDVVLAGDASGVVAPASGEGIYYAMVGGRVAANAVQGFLVSGNARALRAARRDFMQAHGMVFWVLGIMQRFWYSSDKRRERFVSICKDPDVQRLTWQAYMHKKLVRAKPMTHVRIFAKDMAHLLGLVRA